MKIRMCPLCDSEMKRTHHCDVCNSFIWNPIYMDVHYNTEIRGMGEADCAYGSEHDGRHHRNYDESQSVEDQRAAANRQESMYENQVNKKQNRPKTPENPTSGTTINPTIKSTTRSTKKPWFLKVFFGVFFGYWILIVIIGLLRSGVVEEAFDHFRDEFGGYYETEPVYEDLEHEDIDPEYTQEGDDSYIQLPEAEVLATGQECDGYYHMDYSGPDMIEAWEAFLERQNIREHELSLFDYNTITTDMVDGEAVDTSFYEKVALVEVNEPGNFGSFYCSYDTVSKRIHFINAEVLHVETVEQVLNFWEEHTGLDLGVSEVLQLCEEMSYGTWESYYTEDNAYIISINKSENDQGSAYDIYLE